MPLLNNPGNPLTAQISQIIAPLNRFLTPPKYRGEDFPEGLIIEELSPGAIGDKVVLRGSFMPFQPLPSGGKQHLVKEWYPGNPEATIQVMGPREENISVKGRLKANRFGSGDPITDLQARNVVSQTRDRLDKIRIRGNMVKITIGEFVRWGFLEQTKFNLMTLSEIEYELDFSILSLETPKDCKFGGEDLAVPLQANIDLAVGAIVFKERALGPPDNFNLTLFEQVAALVGDLSAVIAGGVAIIDSLVASVEEARNIAARAFGMAKYLRSQVSVFKRRMGILDMYYGSDPADETITTWNETIRAAQSSHILETIHSTNTAPTTISPEIRAAIERDAPNYSTRPSTIEAIKKQTQAPSIEQSLRTMMVRYAALSVTIPRFRHLIRQGDTLQSISMRYYKTADHWERIKEHNKILTSNLTPGQVLEIPSL